MAYGPSIAVPLTDGSVGYSPYNPGRNAPWPEDPMPALKDASPNVLRLQNTLAKRLPAMPASAVGDLSFTNYRELEALQYMQDLAVGQAERKQYEKYSKQVSRAKDQQAQKFAEKSGSNYNSRSAKKLSDNMEARSRAMAYRAINSMSGPNPYQYMFPIR